MDKNIKQEKSYGIIPVYKKGNQLLFLLVKHSIGHWAFPKGHIEKGENPIQTAKRELAEETAIVPHDIKIIEDTTFTENYSFTKDGQEIEKTNGYFIGITDKMEVKILEKEISEYKWADYETALQTITFDKSKKILQKAKKYLNTQNIFNSKTEEIENTAFVDGQNVYMSTISADKQWSIDLVRFRVYLKQKYKVAKAYYFLGFVQEENQDLYDEIQEAGFILKFRKHNSAMLGKKKGNVDTDIVFNVMKKIYKKEIIDSVILISGDGDYKMLVDFLIEEEKFGKILFPNQKKASSLYKQIPLKFRADLNGETIRRKIGKKKRAP